MSDSPSFLQRILRKLDQALATKDKTSSRIIQDRHDPLPLNHPGRQSGAFDLSYGDRFVYDIDGRTGIAGEFMQDGDCCVTWDDGNPVPGMIKWNQMSPLPKKHAR